MADDEAVRLAASVLMACRQQKLMLATAESCTGGLVAAALTETAGSSDVFERGFVTYANAAKTACLYVPHSLIIAHGAVSSPVAEAMAAGALRASRADLALAVTGIAGPGGGSVEKPVGLVWFGFAGRTFGTTSQSRIFAGDRAAVRHGALLHALRGLHDAACRYHV